MGLTIHYSIRSQTRSLAQAQKHVEAMRQLALDLPFDEVRDVCVLGPEVCQTPLDDLRNDEDTFSTVLSATNHGVVCPWGKKRHMSYSCQPTHVISFEIVPGPGSEWASIGLACYPPELNVTYRPMDDDHFLKTIKQEHSTSYTFDGSKWRKWLARTGRSQWESPEEAEFQEPRPIKTNLPGWRYSSFCKTQYASDPACGGLPNFLRCHISVITLLDRIKKLPAMSVTIEDEGKYGPSTYSDDWKAAYAEKRQPTYNWHEGKYDPKALAEEVGDWNQMMACMVGSMNDALKSNGLTAEAPITQFGNFEQLEFRGQRDHEQLGPFLAAMKDLAAQIAREARQ